MSYRVIILVLVMILFINAFPAFSNQFESEKLNNVYISEPVQVENKMAKTLLIDCCFGVEDGRQVLYTVAAGNPAIFVVFDVEKREIIRKITIPVKKEANCWTIVTDSKGRVYFPLVGYLFVYNPETKQIENKGETLSAAGEMQSMYWGGCVDENDTVYFGSYPESCIFKYSYDKNKLELVNSTTFPGEDYVRALALGQDGYLYAGGNSEKASIARVDRKTGKTEILPEITHLDGEYPTYIQGLSERNGYLFVNFNSSKSRTIFSIFNIKENKWLEGKEYNFSTYGFYVSPLKDNKVYLFNSEDGFYYCFDTITGEISKTHVSGTTDRTSKFYKFPATGDEEFLVSVQSDGSVSYISWKTGQIERFYPDIGGVTVSVRSFERGTAGTDTLITGAYMGKTMGIINDRTMRMKTKKDIEQIEGMGEAHSKYYLGTYTHGQIYEFDVETLEKKLVANLFDLANQDRPFKVIEAGKYVAIATVANYGDLNGALSLYDPETGKTEVFKGVIPNQSVISLAYRDGKIYGSTSAWGGLGIDPVDLKAKLFIFDLETKKVTRVSEPQLKAHGTETMFIGDISFSPDGQLWGASNGVIFRADPDTLEIMNEYVMNNASYSLGWKVETPRYAPHAIEWLDEDIFVTNGGAKPTLFDIRTGESLRITNDSVSYMAVSENGNLYTAAGDYETILKRMINLDGDSSGFMEGFSEDDEILAGYDVVFYDSFGFGNQDLLEEKNISECQIKKKLYTIKGASFEGGPEAEVRIAVGGKSGGTDFAKNPHSVTLAKKDGLNALKVEIPAAGQSVQLGVPVTDLSGNRKDKDYVFYCQLYSENGFETVNAPSVSVSFYDRVGEEIYSTRPIKTEKGNEWCQVLAEIKATEIPSNAAYMKGIIYFPKGCVTKGTYLATPGFFYEGTENEEETEFFANSSVIMKAGSSAAFVNRFKILIDKEDETITPVLADGVAAAPLRFIAETAGAEVLWDASESKVIITNADDNIDISVKGGEASAMVNGKEIPLKTKTFIKNGRTFVSVKEIAEALGRKVYSDESGMIIITDDKAFDPVKDSAIIRSINSYFGR